MGVYTAVARIGRPAEVRKTGGGTSVAGFPAAVNVGYGEHKQTLWLDCSLWGKRAEGGLIQYLTKGQEVFVSGEIGTREFKRGDGSPGFAVTLKIAEIELVGSRGQGNDQGQSSQGHGGQQQGGYQQQPQNQRPPQHSQQAGNYGAPDPSQYDSFDDEIPF